MKINTGTSISQVKTGVKQEVKKDDAALLQGTQDQAVISGEEQAGAPEIPQKHKCLIRRGVEGFAGVVGGVAGSTLLAPAGFLEGMAEGNSSYKLSDGARPSTGPLTFTALAGGAATGAVVAGYLTGWSLVGGAIGAGVGLLAGGITRGLMDISDADGKFTSAVDVAVDKAVADNPAGGSGAKKIANTLRNAGEGATAGTIAGVKAGYDVGNSVGSGVASAVISLGTGLASGVGRIITAPFKGGKEEGQPEKAE